MLAYLHVKNIALIEDLEIDFNQGLNILTGETGAGKSIILGSIHYVLGAKVKKGFIRQGALEAFVECVFDISNYKDEILEIYSIFEENGISKDDQGIIMSRKTAQNGRSVFRINGEVVRLEVMESLAGYLIDIHSQHEHQSLLRKGRQLDMLDQYIGDTIRKELKAFESVYNELNKLKKSVNEDYLDDDKRRREIAFLEFEIGEISEAGLEEGEDNGLQKVYDKLSHKRVIVEKLSQVDQELYENPNVSEIISSSIGSIDRVVGFDDELIPILDGLTQIEDFLAVMKRDISRYLDGLDDYEEELFYTEKRLDVINQLKIKYGDTVTDILAYLAKKEEEHEYLVNFEKKLFQTKAKIKGLEDELQMLAAKVHVIRETGAKELQGKITQALQELNLKDALFNIVVEATTHYTNKGSDQVRFLITTNKGESLKPLDEVASGGELSRVMLAIKSILAKVDGVDTLIFDEIDTGISGQTAQKVAQQMRQLSKERQIICITHLPQIAAMADQHYHIHKEVVGESTLTFVDLLSEEESISELARIISGAVTTDIVYANAKEMKEYAKKI